MGPYRSPEAKNVRATVQTLQSACWAERLRVRVLDKPCLKAALTARIAIQRVGGQAAGAAVQQEHIACLMDDGRRFAMGNFKLSS